MASRIIHGCVLGLACLASGEVLAAANYSGTIQGNFSGEQTTGNYIDWRRGFIADNNGADAVFSYAQTQMAGFNNLYRWGQPAAGSFASSLLFTGQAFAAVKPSTNFQVGTLTYTNGTINIGTGTYGGNFTISGVNVTDNNGNAVAVTPLTVAFTNYDTVNYTPSGVLPAAIAALINLGGGAAPAWTPADVVSADFFFVPALGVYAFTREGKSVSFDIQAQIVGDPFLAIAGLTLDPSSVNDGFVISPTQEQQIEAYDATEVPEPGSFAAFLSGLLGMGLIRRRAARS